MNPIAQNLQEVRAAIAAAAHRAGRDPGSVRLVAVSKTVDLPRLRAAIDAGHDLFGENYLQEARDKIAALGRQVSWHLVGSLQSNKARGAVELFDLIHAVDRLQAGPGPGLPPRPDGQGPGHPHPGQSGGRSHQIGRCACGGAGAAPGSRPTCRTCGFWA